MGSRTFLHQRSALDSLTCKALNRISSLDCGIHVHVDASNHNRQSLKNLIGIMYSKEDILFKALQVS